MAADIAAVAIGRNEGERLVRCLASLRGQVDPVIYVDSGSSDGSVAAARAAGAEVVELDVAIPFTAARARNAGLGRLLELAPGVSFIQFLDGDCELVEGWLDVARAALMAEPDLAAVTGRRRERFPEATIWNRMIDIEWDTPVGEATECGGDALMRREALEAVGGYDPSLIAGEEPEMCYRMRQKGWRVRRIDAEMTRHDAAMARLSQWWQRSRRTGYAFAEGAAMHGRGPERYRVRELRSLMFWGMAVPGTAILGTVLWTPSALALLLAWPMQMLRLRWQGLPREVAVFLVLGKLPEAQGALGYWWGRITGRRRRLIEYK